MNIHFGGSILPSSEPRILAPLTCGFGRLVVRPLPDENTYALVFMAVNGVEAVVAKHPNGYSCRALAERMAARDGERICEQAEYIVRCGGKTIPVSEILTFTNP